MFRYRILHKIHHKIRNLFRIARIAHGTHGYKEHMEVANFHSNPSWLQSEVKLAQNFCGCTAAVHVSDSELMPSYHSLLFWAFRNTQGSGTQVLNHPLQQSSHHKISSNPTEVKRGDLGLADMNHYRLVRLICWHEKNISYTEPLHLQ